MSFDPITLNQIKKALVKDKATVTHIEAGVAVNTNASFVTLKSEAGPKKGHIVALVVHQSSSSGRTLDELKITVDGNIATSTGLYASSGSPFPSPSGSAAYPIVLPLNARFKSSFTVEAKGNGSSGSFYGSVIWTEEV